MAFNLREFNRGLTTALIYGAAALTIASCIQSQSEIITEQRVDDLDHECERCGDVATENVSEVEGEYNWRCDKCKPRNVMPKLKNWPKVTPKKMERNIV